MWITFSKDDPLEDVVAEVERVYGVTLSVVEGPGDGQGDDPEGGGEPVDPGLLAQADDWSERGWHDGGGVG